MGLYRSAISKYEQQGKDKNRIAVAVEPSNVAIAELQIVQANGKQISGIRSLKSPVNVDKNMVHEGYPMVMSKNRHLPVSFPWQINLFGSNRNKINAKQG